jgi:hypothetical protein
VSLRYGKPAFLNGGFAASRRDLDFTASMRAARTTAKGEVP